MDAVEISNSQEIRLRAPAGAFKRGDTPVDGDGKRIECIGFLYYWVQGVDWSWFQQTEDRYEV